ncbi:DMT family transporter [Bacillus sp. ISL-35]|uniref:DMT family transporter n=1 Tax=Bacillus sp. ISL-35 TaxID=2819122 RepID=UPI001BE83EC9|nr:DMT family transporter [Bacillus sp. ISL-35]MBT2680613.1 DMT family transporter [Bacillus sp. ISL-35]MBT2704092.1 DMT family transporter [Chryseobacterium sp. ISL-80]
MGIIMILFTFFGGITLSAQSSINGTLSRKAGTLETTLLTFLTGTMFLAISILFFGKGNVLGILEVPKWQLSAAFLGTLYLLLTVMAVPRIGVIATNIAGIAGQLVIGVLIDHFGWFNSMVISLDMKRAFALLFMLIALYFIYKGNKRSSEETNAQHI